MKTYQITVAIVAACVVVAFYAVFTSHRALLVHAVEVLAVASLVLVYCLHLSKKAEDLAYSRKYHTVIPVKQVIPFTDYSPLLVVTDEHIVIAGLEFERDLANLVDTLDDMVAEQVVLPPAPPHEDAIVL